MSDKPWTITLHGGLADGHEHSVPAIGKEHIVRVATAGRWQFLHYAIKSVNLDNRTATAAFDYEEMAGEGI